MYYVLSLNGVEYLVGWDAYDKAFFLAESWHLEEINKEFVRCHWLDKREQKALRRIVQGGIASVCSEFGVVCDRVELKPLNEEQLEAKYLERLADSAGQVC